MSQIRFETNARMSPVNVSQIHHPNSVDQLGLPHQKRMQLKKGAYKMRIGTLIVEEPGPLQPIYREKSGCVMCAGN